MKFLRQLVALTLAGAVTIACGAGSAVRSMENRNALAWKKVDIYLQEGEGEPEDYDAQYILDGDRQVVQVTAEDNPEAVLAELPYGSVEEGVYSLSEHPRWKAGGGAALAIGIFALPVFFMDSKRHWLTLQASEPVPGLPEGYLVLRLDKDNWRSIVNATEAQLALEIERRTDDRSSN